MSRLVVLCNLSQQQSTGFAGSRIGETVELFQWTLETHQRTDRCVVEREWKAKYHRFNRFDLKL